MFGNLTHDGLEESQDRLGGFSRFDSGAYTGKVKAAYAGKSATSAAQSVTVIMDFDGKEYRETFWVTNSKGENWFRNKDDNTKKVPLPGFTIVDDLCLVTTNKPLSLQGVEDKVMNVYDPDAKKELPKSVPMLVELIGTEVTFGIVKVLEFKQKKNDAGEYVDTDETRESNVTDKIFHHPSNLTVAEARRGETQSAFYGAWVERNKGVTRDKTKGKAPAAAGGIKNGRPSGPPQAGAAQTPRTSLFGAR